MVQAYSHYQISTPRQHELLIQLARDRRHRESIRRDLGKTWSFGGLSKLLVIIPVRAAFAGLLAASCFPQARQTYSDRHA
jgi:hypothetical protein